ncbi:metal ABC transporter solute-binding protein, Zn/Mn family [Ornithinibacillus halophilus]|uniref:Manganese/zinc/iron transport system substrate-binding protein n=1 Tax=Ornithinibacillus halophilus TaxID=930117 RepID=A0A1M5DYJ8_9BACI|nr:zinc ABC transporter substrate-binding protein [Ornithinibacillus halophilus]SHF71944.1 manganese/zinc/iron transport system substrate-binding protein [Ornithinibacillus halophilus]
MKGLLKLWCSVFLLSIVLLLGACGTDEESASKSDGEISIITTIAQIGEPLSVIGGEYVDVNSLMGPSVDPHLYNATHGDISKIEEADMAFYNGLNLEANMVEIFDEMSQSKPVLAIGETVSEDSLLEDETGAVDPHIWFDLDLWKHALESAVDELKEFAPEHADYFEENKVEYFEQMDELKEEAKKLEEIPVEQRYLVTAHDAFGYFGEMHDLEVIGLQGLSTDGEIGVSDIQETIDIIIDYKVPAVFVESSISEDSIKAVIEGADSEGVTVELGGELFSDAMGEDGTKEGTYLGMYRHNVDTIYNALMKGAE